MFVDKTTINQSQQSLDSSIPQRPNTPDESANKVELVQHNSQMGKTLDEKALEKAWNKHDASKKEDRKGLIDLFLLYCGWCCRNK